jgi:L-iditol 2-dehydrogenase
LDFARRLGAVPLESNDPQLPSKIRDLTGARGVDLCIVATGNIKAMSQSLSLTRRGGEVVIFGVPPKGVQVPVDLSQLYSSEVSLIPTYAASEKETNKALQLIAERRIDVNPLITHRFDLRSAQEAIKCAHEAKDAVKVVVINNV